MVKLMKNIHVHKLIEDELGRAQDKEGAREKKH
jgi:hypothetical protein